MALRRFRALCDTCRSGACSASPPRPAAMPKTGPPSSRRPSASAASRSTFCPAGAKPNWPRSASSPESIKPDGIAGDLGGGSLELIDVRGSKIRRGVTVPLGGLALKDVAEQFAEARRARSPRTHCPIVPFLKSGQGPHLLRRRRRVAFAGESAHGANRLSAACHARLHIARRARRWNSANWCSGSIPRRCRISKWCRPRAVRCWVMPRSCSAG